MQKCRLQEAEDDHSQHVLRVPLDDGKAVHRPLLDLLLKPMNNSFVQQMTGGQAGNVKTAFFKVTLGGREFTRHGDHYALWFDRRDPRSGRVYRRSREVTTTRVRNEIDAAIGEFLRLAEAK